MLSFVKCDQIWSGPKCPLSSAYCRSIKTPVITTALKVQDNNFIEKNYILKFGYVVTLIIVVLTPLSCATATSSAPPASPVCSPESWEALAMLVIMMAITFS